VEVGGKCHETFKLGGWKFGVTVIVLLQFIKHYKEEWIKV
jgi:hypothetical protein